MASRYHHTQRGTLMLIVMSISGIGCAAIGYFGQSQLPWALAAGAVILAWLFSSLTVEVDENEIRWHFGPGLWKYRLPRAEIAIVQTTHSNWWMGILSGYGIRMRPGYRLYTVSGLDAVELRLKSGDVRRIGTDDPEGLAAALRT